MNAKIVRDTIAHLDGKIFECRQDIEDAVFPVFGKLQSMFTGEGHRDLVDRLIRARWIEVEGKNWKVTLPVASKFAPVEDAKPVNEQEFQSPEDQDSEDPPLPSECTQAIYAIYRKDYALAIRLLSSLLPPKPPSSNTSNL